jgi:hypothetical protein
VARLKNVSGEAREVPLLDNRVVEADEIVEVDDQLLTDYTWPETTWQAVADAERTVEELRAELKARDLPTSGTKPELLERLADADKAEDKPGEVG